MNIRFFFCLLLLFFGNIPSLLSQDIDSVELIEKNFNQQDSFQRISFESNEILWKVDLKKGIIAAWDTKTARPLWSEDGVVFRCEPRCSGLITDLFEPSDSPNQSGFLDPSSRIIQAESRVQTESAAQTNLTDQSDESLKDWIQLENGNSRISSIFGRLYILLDEPESFDSEDSASHSLNSPTFFQKEEGTLRSKTLLIALNPQAEGRLVWMIRSLDIPLDDVHFESVPQENEGIEDFLSVPFQYKDRNQGQTKSLFLQIDAATGEWSLRQDKINNPNSE